MNNFWGFILALFFIIITSTAQAQFFENPSLEGNNTFSSSLPYYWTPCTVNATPDTQPGSWGINLYPSDGDTYMGLVAIGTYADTSHYRNRTYEDAQTKLVQPFLKNRNYEFDLDLAYSDKMEDAFESFANPLVLRVWGGSSSCDKSQLLWTSPAIDHAGWKNYKFEFTPSEDITWIILEAYYASLPEYFGNILIDDIKVNVKIPIDLGPDIDICYNELPVKLQSNLINEHYKYLWNTGDSTSEIEVNETGTYSLTIDSAGFQTTDYIDVKVTDPIPLVELGENAVLCPGDRLNLQVNVPLGAFVRWSTGSISSSLQVSTPGLYAVEVYNECETITDEIFVEYKQSCCDLNMPNAFTPNGDPYNSTFKIEGQKERIANYYLKIFNRFGELIFESNSFEKEWDGTIHGNAATTGVYFWEIIYTCNFGEDEEGKHLKGHISVLR